MARYKKPQPWSASTASKRWDFSLPFGHKRKDSTAGSRPPGRMPTEKRKDTPAASRPPGSLQPAKPKRRDPTASVVPPRSQQQINPTAAARHLPLHRGGMRERSATSPCTGEAFPPAHCLHVNFPRPLVPAFKIGYNKQRFSNCGGVSRRRTPHEVSPGGYAI